MALEKRKKLWWNYPLKWIPAAEDKDIQKVKEILSKYISPDTIE